MTEGVATSYFLQCVSFPYLVIASLCVVLLLLIQKLMRKTNVQQDPLPGPLAMSAMGSAYNLIKLFIYRDIGRIKPVVYLLQFLSALTVVMPDYKLAFFRVVNKGYVLLWKPEAVEVILSSSVLLDKSRDYNYFHSWLGTGLLTSHGDKWRSRRKLLTPTFHYRILEDFFPIINEEASILVDKMRERLKADDKETEIFDVVPMVAHCTLDIICETALGAKMGAQNNSSSIYVQSVNNVSHIILSRILKFWYWNETIFKLTSLGKKYFSSLDVLHGFTRKAITERKLKILQDRANNSEETTGGRKAFLDLLLHYHLADPSLLTEEDIREEVDTFTFEGHDTTAMGISWALYLIGLYPEIQLKIQQELESVCESKSNVTLENLKNMKYLECVIKESQRLYPSVPLISRELKQDVDICGHQIPAGTFIVILTYELHRNPNIYPNPECFDPERFTLENSTGRHPYAYIPFSAGPRNCIGQRFAMMEEKTVLAKVLMNFHVTSVDPRDRIHVLAEMISRSDKGIRIKLRPR